MLSLCSIVCVGLALPTPRPKLKPTRVAVLGGGFAGLTAARVLSSHPGTEVLLVDQRDYFEYTPGILRAWVKPDVHRGLVNPIRRLLRSKRATFRRVPPGCACQIVENDDGGETSPLLFSIRDTSDADAPPLVEHACDYVVLATGGELSPLSDDRLLPDGTIKARRRRLREQVSAVMANATSALVVGGGLTGVELAAELAERLGPGRVTLAVGPTRAERSNYPGDPGAGLLPGFRDTCGWKINLGRGGVVRYVRKWLQRRGVLVLESWAVPPPRGASLADVTVGRREQCARSWRAAATSADGQPGSWEEAGAAADLAADVVFDCRGVRPNTRESYTQPERGDARLGLRRECVAPSGWLRVDDKFRLSRRARRASDGDAWGMDMRPMYGGRVYCCGCVCGMHTPVAPWAFGHVRVTFMPACPRAHAHRDAAEKDKQERTAANAHAEGEYVALDVLRAVDGKSPLPPYVLPPRLCAISLGRWDGVVVLGPWVVLRGFLAAVAKALIQVYFVNFLPLPYWLMRRMPGRQPRRYGGSGGASIDVQLARSGSAGLFRSTLYSDGTVEGGEEGQLVDPTAVRPAADLVVLQDDGEPDHAAIVAFAAALAAAVAGAALLARAGLGAAMLSRTGMRFV